MIAIAIIILFKFSYLESSLIIFAITLVLVTEVFNTVLEDTLDEFRPDQNQRVGNIKDMMATAVLVSSLGALAIGILVYVRHF